MFHCEHYSIGGTLTPSSFTGNFGLHVPRTNGLLRQGHLNLWLLHSCHTAHNHSLFCHSLPLVRKYNASSLHWWGTERTFVTTEGPLPHGFFPQPLRRAPSLRFSDWI